MKASLGSTCEITIRYEDFSLFARENPQSARFALQSESRDLLPNERVKNCLRVRRSQREPVDILYVSATNSAHFGNLQTCGSIWICPICASKITSRRRSELSLAVEVWTGRGNRILLATFTLQHFVGEPCADILLGILKSFSKLWGERAGQKLLRKYKVIGRVRGLEVTYTLAGGWHWHIHGLFFVEGEISPGIIGEMQGDFSEVWQGVLGRHGRYADGQHGVTIRFTDREIADYVAKYGEGGLKLYDARAWTEAHELALSPVKKAAVGGYTPTQLLGLSLCGAEDAGRLFVEYHKAVKGKSQLYWSRGLRGLLGLVKDKSDEEIAEEQDQTAAILARLDRDQWRIILANDARSDLLKVAKTGDVWAVLDFLEDFGLTDVYYPLLLNDPNYLGLYRVCPQDDDDGSGVAQ